MKRKYLHVEILDGSLHVYLDDKKRGQTVSVDELDNECLITDTLNKNKTITIFIKDLISNS